MTGPLFPGNYSTVWIRGRFITMAGAAVRGKLTLAPTVTGGALVNRSAKLIMSSAPFSADTDNDGYVAVQVPATNDPDITPLNFTYSVTTPIGQKFSVTVPYNTLLLDSAGDPLHGQPVIELIDMVPVGSAGGVGQLLRGDPGRGIASAVSDGQNLVVTYDDGATQVAGPLPVGPAGPAGLGLTDHGTPDVAFAVVDTANRMSDLAIDAAGRFAAHSVASMTAKQGLYKGPTTPTPAPGSGEYVWFKTDGNGALLDILSGKA